MALCLQFRFTDNCKINDGNLSQLSVSLFQNILSTVNHLNFTAGKFHGLAIFGDIREFAFYKPDGFISDCKTSEI